jgi:hypothetical protein
MIDKPPLIGGFFLLSSGNHKIAVGIIYLLECNQLLVNFVGSPNICNEGIVVIYE